MSDEELARLRRNAAENVRRGYGRVPYLSSAATVELIDRLTAALDTLLDRTAADYSEAPE